jgi:dihydropteroate synthase
MENGVQKVTYTITLGNNKYDLEKETLIMGILNVTPDSFSDGGKFNKVEAALKHAEKMKEDGAHIIDIGGESTRPGFKPVSVEEELERVVPIIEALSKEINLPISIDTYKAKVAEEAVKAGADIINDVWGAKKEPEIAAVSARYKKPIILMHNRTNSNYNELIPDMKTDLMESIQIAKSKGVNDEQIIIDPGVGFAKSHEDNLATLRYLNEFKTLGYPILLGTSRKSVINNVLHLPVEDRVEGTGATVCLGIERGAHIVRVHDVKQMARIAKMMDALLGKGV